MALLASLRSTIAYQTTGSTISTGAIYQTVSGGAPVWSNALVSSMVSIGASTNQVYTTLSQGNFVSSVSTSSWVSSLTNRVSTTTVAMSANAQYQLALSQSSISTSVMFTSTLGTSPSAWSTLSGATGLPNYSTISYTAGAVSGTGQYGVLGTSNNNLYTTSTFGSSWTNTNLSTIGIYLPFDTVPASAGTYIDTTGRSAVTYTGPPTQAPSYVTGTGAVRLTNAPGGVSSQYIQGTWGNVGLTSFTISFWFNIQSYGANASYIFSAYNGALAIVAAQTNNNLVVNIPITASPYYATFTIPSPIVPVVNTWYNITIIYQSSGTCYLYLNNALYGTIAGAGLFGGTQTNKFGISGFDSTPGTSASFNGYIDDLKIYNSAIFTLPSPLSLTYSSVAVSNTGQYMLATVTNGGLFMSSNFGSTWSQVTGTLLSAIWSAAQISGTGQYMLAHATSTTGYITPQLTALFNNVWTVNGITWTSTASTQKLGYNIYRSFNNTTGDGWLSDNTYNSSGTTSSITATTTVLGGVGSVAGEWIQIQSSFPVTLHSFAIAIGPNAFPNTNTPINYLIVGSIDNSNWYPLQEGTFAVTNGRTGVFTGKTSNIIMNSTSTQTLTGLVGTVATTANFTFVGKSYTYFRLIGKQLMNYGISQISNYMELGQWYINFIGSNGIYYSTNYGASWYTSNNIIMNSSISISESGQYALGASVISPQQSGLIGNISSAIPVTPVTTSWTKNNITWTSKANTVYSSTFQPWIAFNNLSNVLGGSAYSYASEFKYDGPGGAYNASGSGSTTINQSGGTVTSPYRGEWLQIQSSVPLVMYSYNFAASNTDNFPKTYLIAGSQDESIWYPIQLVSINTNPFLASLPNATASSPNILVNQSGSQTMTAGTSGTLTCTTYTTTTTAYSYFRIIINSTFNTTSGTLSGTFELQEWYITFLNSSGGTIYNVVSPLTGFSTNLYTPGTIPGVITGSAVSNTGQYMLFITNNTTGHNVYYSINYGTTFTGIQVGTQVLTSCAMSYDGSYITIASGATIYTLNNNSTGFSLALGNQAGYQNQGQNAIAIGNYAGFINQTANSIILNASGQGILGTGLNSYAPGFYVAPIASYVASVSPTINLLGYGTDNQIVQTAITVASGANSQTIYGEWIQYQLSIPVSITSYILQPRQGFNSRYPIAWYIIGSSDAVSWTILDYQTNGTVYLWGIQYILKTASPLYNYYRIVFTQLPTAETLSTIDIAGFTLFNLNGPIFSDISQYSVVSSGLYNTLQQNSNTVCITTFSWPNSFTANSFGISSDGVTGASFPCGWLPTTDNWANGSAANFLGFSTDNRSIAAEYNSSGIATQGTSTIATSNTLITSIPNSVDINGTLYVKSLSINGYNYERAIYIMNTAAGLGTATAFSRAGSGSYVFSMWAPINITTYSVYGGSNLLTSASQNTFRLPYVGIWKFEIAIKMNGAAANPTYLIFTRDNSTYTSTATKTIIGTGPDYQLSTGIIYVTNKSPNLLYLFGVYTGDSVTYTFTPQLFVCTYLG